MDMPQLRPRHIGRSIKKIRQLREIKQSVIADALGTTQSAVSAIESSEEVDDEKLEIIAKALGVNADAIRDFNEDVVINQFWDTNNHDNNDASVNINTAAYYEMGSADRLVEAYERILKMEQERYNTLEQRIKALEADREKNS